MFSLARVYTTASINALQRARSATNESSSVVKWSAEAVRRPRICLFRQCAYMASTSVQKKTQEINWLGRDVLCRGFAPFQSSRAFVWLCREMECRGADAKENLPFRECAYMASTSVQKKT